MKRNIIFVIGLFFIPLFWVLFNTMALVEGGKYESLKYLYNDYYNYYKSGESFGVLINETIRSEFIRFL